MIDIQQKRIEWICECLYEPSSLEKIIGYVQGKVASLKVNEVLRNKGIRKRTIESDLKRIRLGEFSYMNEFENSPKGTVLFDIQYNRRTNKYAFSETSERPVFDSVTQEEILTMPFVNGVLNPYREIAGINRLIKSFEAIYDFNNPNVFSKNALVTFVERNDKSKDAKKKILEKTVTLLDIISQKKAITLMYSSVSTLIPNLADSTKKFILFPFQVRIHDGLHYLIALDLEGKKIKNFRVDHIKSKIHILDENDDENDDLEKEILRLNNFNTLQLKHDFFDYSFGIWCHNYPRKIYKIAIAFYDWAASYILINPLHSTQELISIEQNEAQITILLNIENTPQAPYDVENISKELAFELGRFRNSCEIKSIELSQK